jgi:hypothetical protein
MTGMSMAGLDPAMCFLETGDATITLPAPIAYDFFGVQP